MPRMEWDKYSHLWCKECPRCKTLIKVQANTWEEACKEMFAFFRASHNNQDGATTFDGMRPSCRSCDQNQTGGRVNDVHRDTMLVNQKGECGICETPITFAIKNGACVDHDHKTGKIRLVLCNKCNIFMAGVDNDEWLVRAIAYRDRFRG